MTKVCSHPLRIPILGLFFNHSYIEDHPYRYAIIGPLCEPTDGGPNNVITGAVANKLDNSPESIDKDTRCIPCLPKSGLDNVSECLRNEYNKYNNPSLYKALGPNSNTFTGTMARACCANMENPTKLGRVPGWTRSPAPRRSGICNTK